MTVAAAFAVAFPFYRDVPTPPPLPVGERSPIGEVALKEKRPFSALFTPPAPLSEKETALAALRNHKLEASDTALANDVRQGGDNLELYLQAGFSPDALDPEGEPLLFLAAQQGEDLVRRLLDAGADPNQATPTGQTAVIAAAANGSLPTLEALLAHGAKLQWRDHHGHNALYAAAQHRQTAALEWLLQQGVDPAGSCCNGSSSLLAHALEAESMPIAERLLKAERPLHWRTATREALYLGIRKRDKALVRLLLENHGMPPTPEGYAQPLLGYAIAWGETEVVQLLLECGADANVPLQSPVEPAFARLIEQKVARYYLEKEGGMTPLMLAAALGQEQSVATLLQHGAKRGAVTKRSRMAALSFAARSRHTAIMQRLLGKDPQQQRMRIEISLASQRATLWRDGEIIASTRVSTGRSGYATPPGEFVITDKHRSRVSNLYHVKMPFFMRLNCSDIGMHAGVVPNRPASHGCIRLPADVAKRFFRDVEVGTVVTIH